MSQINSPHAEVSVSSARALREFVLERLTAAAVEIFSVFEQTLTQYEIEMKYHRKQTQDWTTQINQQEETAPSQQHVGKTEEFLCEQPRSSGPDQEERKLPHIKEEPDELLNCIAQEGEQHLLKQDIDTLIETPIIMNENHCNDQERNNEQQPFFHIPPTAESHEQQQSTHGDSGVRYPEWWSNEEYHENRYQSNGVNNAHASDKPCCEACGRQFRDKYTLSVHMRTHTGAKPFTCKICGKCYRDRHGLVYHMSCHTGEKLYSCKICGKRFRQSSHLIVHMRIHTGEKPFSCATCGKRFIQQGHLNAHKKTHKVASQS